MWLFLTLCVLIGIGNGLGECTEKCAGPTVLYNSLQCTPVFASTNDCCPSKYDCSHIEERSKLNESKCYFEGRAYSGGESVDNDNTYSNCKVGCTCRSVHEEGFKSDFNCAILDCPEWLGYHPGPGCYLKYELGKCCSAGKSCSVSESTCEVNGKTVHVGSRFENPTDKCSECVCKEGFNGEFKEPFCRKRKCIEEITNQKEVYEFCAPSFIAPDDCCPFTWICPEESDQIEKVSTTSENKCRFGSSLLNIGDKFSKTKKGGKGKADCECKTPPYVTCIQNYDYGW